MKQLRAFFFFFFFPNSNSSRRLFAGDGDVFKYLPATGLPQPAGGESDRGNEAVWMRELLPGGRGSGSERVPADRQTGSLSPLKLQASH